MDWQLDKNRATLEMESFVGSFDLSQPYLGLKFQGRDRPGDVIQLFAILVTDSSVETYVRGVDLVNKYPREELPASLTGYIRGREEYDYRHHAEVGSSNADYIEDDVIDRFAVIGGPDEHVRRIMELHDAGVDQFNLYLMSGDEEAQLEAYGSTIIPAFKAALDAA